MTKQTNFPPLPFKLRCGDDPKVRQWLKDNGCKWRNGDELMEHGKEYRYLTVGYGHLVGQNDSGGLKFHGKRYEPEINPYDYISTTEEKTVGKFTKGQIVYVNDNGSDAWVISHYSGMMLGKHGTAGQQDVAVKGGYWYCWDNCLSIEEYQEMVSKPNYEDWPIDAKVLAWDEGGELIKARRHFAGVDENGKPLVFWEGKTSHTANGKSISYDYVELYEDE